MPNDDAEIPPLTSATVFTEWGPVVRDKIKATSLGIVYRMPDPRKRDRFTGSSRCTQEGHPLFDQTPAKETVAEYQSLCEKWVAASMSAAAKVRGALSKNTKKGACLLPDQDDYFALLEWLRTQHKDEKPTVSLRDLLKFKYEGGTIQEHNSRFLDALHVVENVSKPPQPQTMAMVSEVYLGSLPTKFSRRAFMIP